MIVDITKVTTQRDMFRTLVKRYGKNNKAAIIRAYARAEEAGKVIRIRNTMNIDAWKYAEFLYSSYRSREW